MQQYDFPNKPNLDLNFSPKLVVYALGLILLLWLASGIYIVNPEEQAIVLRFGEAIEISDSGIHYHLPRPIERIEKEKVTQVKRVEIGFRTISLDPAPRYQKVLRESVMLTGDENIVDVELIVQYRISSLEDYLFNVAGQSEAVRGVAESALRQVVGRHTIDQALTEGKLKIQTEIEEEIRTVFELYGMGVRLENVKLQAVSVPREVDPAFKDVASAREDRERLRNEAEAYRNEIIPKARGEAEKQVRQAEAYAVERVKRSQGDADRFLTVLKEYRNARDVTEKRLYLETMEKILPSIQKYVVQSDGKGGLLNVLNLPRQSAGGGSGQ
ncbi:TPA: FtsH protease activity modulator HflK [Candidatus Latescibacteria bacterium]|nr:FtsH protease activity modulator HflK [Candidatus Latescibacterota bacterium]